MRFSRISSVLGALLVGALAWTARGAVDVTIANNTQVDSRLLNPDSVHRYRVFLPAGAKVSAAVKGTKDKATKAAAPAMRLRLLDEFEDELIESGFLDNAKLKAKGVGAKAKATIEDSGEYILEVFSDDGSTGTFSLSVKWVSLKAQKIKDEFFFEGDETDVEVAVDEDAQLTMKVKKAGNSSAQPFFDRIEGDEFEQDLDDASSLKNVTVLEGGDLFVVIGNVAGEGGIAGSVKIRQPKTKKVRVPIEPVKQGTQDKKITGAVAVPSKSVLIEADDEDIVGEDILGASVLLPAGAVSQPTAIQIGTADPLLPPAGAGAGAGPTVFFGPPGLQFAEDVTVTIPFDVDLLDGDDTSGVSVFTEDEDGNVSEIEDVDVDVDNESVSFQTSHFSTFRAFLAGVPAGKSDLDGDGVDDLVAPAPQANQGRGRVYVFSGVPRVDRDTSEADYTIAGVGATESLGTAVAVGDVTGDGKPDLVVLGLGVNDGTCYVFAGGSAFNPGDSGDATFRLDGAVGFGGMQSVAVGDVNGDGVGDIAIGSEDGPTGQGAVVVFFGGTQLRSETTSAADLTFTGEQTGDAFGVSVAIGDLNGDSQPDLAVGADMIDNPGRNGAVYVQFGGSGIQGSAAASMDVVINGSSADAGLGVHIAIGDVTGDQQGDLVASEFDDDLGGPGAVFVFEGGSTFNPRSTGAAVAAFLGSQDETVGSSIQLADVTGDQVLDLLLGARNASDGDGGIYVITGGSQLISEGATVLSTPDIAGPGFFEGFPALAAPLRKGGKAAIVAFAPGNEDAAIGAGAAYVFLGDPRQQGGITTDDADVTISGQEGDSLGGEIF